MNERQIDITPTPEGFQQMVHMFNETVKDAEAKLALVEEFRQKLENWRENWYEFANDEAGITQMIAFEIIFDHRALLSDALETLEGQEHRRIAQMQSGLDELARGGYE